MDIWNCLYFILCSWGSWVLSTSVLDVAMMTVVREIRGGEKRGNLIGSRNSETRDKKDLGGMRARAGTEWGPMKGRGH